MTKHVTHGETPADAAYLYAKSPAARSFPLVALLQLVTFLAAVTVCIDEARLRELMAQDWAWQGVAIAAAILVGGAAVGVFLGFGEIRKWRAATAGALAGFVCGGAVVTVYVAPAHPARAIAAAAILLVTTVAFRIRSA